MPRLAPPTVEVHASFLQAMAEFQAEGRGTTSDRTMIGSETQEFGSMWHTREGFRRYVDRLLESALEESPRPQGWVPQTTFWWVDGRTYLGRLSIRHRLTPSLREVGGHIGYDVRPTARRRGHATAMLAAALPIAHAMGIDPALITCDVGNVASRKVIERNGGRFAERGGDVLRFWVPTG
jgi:predicted acetyltransferase